MRKYAFALFLFPLAALAAEEKNPYCDEMKFTLMSPTIAPALTWQ